MTIAFHLVILIVFLCYSIDSVIQKETSFVLDFTKQEELEREVKEMEFKESVSKELDALLAASNAPRNAAVNLSKQTLKDDRNRNPENIYEDAEELQKKLDASRRAAQEEVTEEDAVVAKEVETQKEEAYQGPSVISYRLDGREANHLPVPAYKCHAGGDIAIAIVVNRKGRVTAAKVIGSRSTSSDLCIIDYAIKAARRSRFSASSTASERQAGEILYRFIAQ